MLLVKATGFCLFHCKCAKMVNLIVLLVHIILNDRQIKGMLVVKTTQVVFFSFPRLFELMMLLLHSLINYWQIKYMMLIKTTMVVFFL
jgi:hypothetical protein